MYFIKESSTCLNVQCCHRQFCVSFQYDYMSRDVHRYNRLLCQSICGYFNSYFPHRPICTGDTDFPPTSRARDFMQMLIMRLMNDPNTTIADCALEHHHSCSNFIKIIMMQSLSHCFSDCFSDCFWTTLFIASLSHFCLISVCR